MQKQRVTLKVEVDMDAVPGWGHQPEDWQQHVERYMLETVGHYNPVVTVDTVRITHISLLSSKGF